MNFLRQITVSSAALCSASTAAGDPVSGCACAAGKMDRGSYTSSVLRTRFQLLIGLDCSAASKLQSRVLEPVARSDRKAVKRLPRRRASRDKRPSASRRRGPTQPAPKAPAGVSSGLAPGMQTLNTYLAVANVGASMDFLEHAFGFEQGVILPDADGQIRYRRDAAWHIGRDADSQRRHDRRHEWCVSDLRVDDVDRALEHARQAGAGVETANDKPWGDRVAASPIPTGIAGCWRRSRSSRRLCEACKSKGKGQEAKVKARLV